MKPIDVVRAWKDATYRESLSSDDLALVPDNPAGLAELSDEELKRASGLAGVIVTTFRTCTEFTFHRFHCCH